MRRFALLIVPFALMMAQDKEPAKGGAKPSPKGKTTTAAPVAAPASGSIKIPADAELVGPRVYRAKDADGRVWLYRQTPFGISRMEETAGTSDRTAALPDPQIGQASLKAAPISASDLGDSIRFEQATPMGKRVWVTKKTELSPKEKAVLEQLNKKEAKQPEK